MKIRPGKSGTIYDYIEQAIHNGEYTYGQQVPTDMELSDKFGASRPTVAKALQALETKGLV